MNIFESDETYNDYPAVKANAKKAIEWKEKYGRDEVKGGTETKVAFTMIYEHSIQSKKMNEVEKEWVANQMRDVLKTIGLTTMAIMPGGAINKGTKDTKICNTF